jgi:hypothetical protein
MVRLTKERKRIMKTTHSASLAGLALLAMACADPAGPNRTLLSDGPSLAVTTNQIVFPGGAFPGGPGAVTLCKTGDAAGSITINVSVNDAAATQVTRTLGAGGGTDCGSGPVFSSINGGNAGFEKVEITEDGQANWALTGIDFIQHVSAFIFGGGNGGYPAGSLNDDDGTATPGQATAFINGDMSRTVTFTNDFTAPPPEGCTYTKGWYQNKNGSPTVLDGVDGRTKAEAQAIFKATPGKPNGVTWGSDNLLLNLYQQFLAALNNLGGDANAHDGPAAVDAAIDATRAGTNGTGLNITTTLTHTEMSSLVSTLSSFNEGQFAGWPHCDD